MKSILPQPSIVHQVVVGIYRMEVHCTVFQTVFCKELTLPPSDLAHNADRVCVIPSVTDNQSASCIAVSPEGIVRYWPNIAYEGSSTEISAELRGDECASVVNFEVLNAFSVIKQFAWALIRICIIYHSKVFIFCTLRAWVFKFLSLQCN